MKILPAIDLKNGKVVMLERGDYEKVSTYSENPLEIAKEFYDIGAKDLHIVDLDGAKDGELSNFNIIENILKNINLSIEVGGGIRDEDRIKKYLDIGVDRVILGTVAAENIDFVKDMVKKYGKNIAVGVDARDGKVAINGWLNQTEIDSIDFCIELDKIGVETIIYTDILRDGMLKGANIEIYKEISEKISCNLIASGGVSSKEDIINLKEINIYGAIIGKGIYSGKMDLKEVLAYGK